MKVLLRLGALLIVTAMLPVHVQADAGTDVRTLQHAWEQAKYMTPEKEQEKTLEALSKRAGEVKQQYPDSAEAEIWYAIVMSTYAGAKGGIGALSLVKDAKKSLEHALQIDPKALNGSAYTSLGSLYYQVPGWPIGFGNDDKARELLQKALEINPDGIDPNYFYGDFLFRQRDYDGAIKALQKALQAPPRPDRPLADEGRKREIQDLLAKIEAKRN